MKFLLKKVHLVLLIMTAMMLQIDAGQQPRKRESTTRTRTAKRVAQRRVGRRTTRRAPIKRTPRAVIQQVKKTTSTFEQILDQSAIMINATGKTARSTRNTAKSEINKLMAQLKTENSKLHQRIHDDVQTILKTGRSAESKDTAKEAYDNLIAVREKLKSEAKQAQLIRKEIAEVKAAAPEEKQAVAAQAVAEIQAGNEAVEQAGIISRVTDFFLDKETSMLTKLFYATVGAATLGAIGYAGYQYGVPAVQKIYGMSWEEWKKLPGEAQAAVKKAWEAATWKNISAGIKATPGAIGSGIYGAGTAGAGYVGTAAGYFTSAYNWFRGTQQVAAKVNEVVNDLTNASNQDPKNLDIKNALDTAKKEQTTINEVADKVANGQTPSAQDKANLQQATENVANVVADIPGQENNPIIQGALKKGDDAQNIAENIANPTAAVPEQITPMEGGVPMPPVIQQEEVIEEVGGPIVGI